MDKKSCLHCGKEFLVKRYRRSVAKYCSHECSCLASRKAPNTECVNCKKPLLIKPSRLKKLKWGAHCSVSCLATTKAVRYKAEANPNYKGHRCDSDGYLYTWSDNAKTLVNTTKEVKLHRAVCADILGVEKISSRFHVHHRDCDNKNNDPDNLSVMTPSDHKWLHKQFGNATLWALAYGKVGLDDLISWSDNKSRARRLLELKVADQCVDELEETERGSGGFGSTGKF